MTKILLAIKLVVLKIIKYKVVGMNVTFSENTEQLLLFLPLQWERGLSSLTAHQNKHCYKNLNMFEAKHRLIKHR